MLVNMTFQHGMDLIPLYIPREISRACTNTTERRRFRNEIIDHSLCCAIGRGKSKSTNSPSTLSWTQSQLSTIDQLYLELSIPISVRSGRLRNLSMSINTLFQWDSGATKRSVRWNTEWSEMSIDARLHCPTCESNRNTVNHCSRCLLHPHRSYASKTFLATASAFVLIVCESSVSIYHPTPSPVWSSG